MGDGGSLVCWRRATSASSPSPYPSPSPSPSHSHLLQLLLSTKTANNRQRLRVELPFNAIAIKFTWRQQHDQRERDRIREREREGEKGYQKGHHNPQSKTVSDRDGSVLMPAGKQVDWGEWQWREAAHVRYTYIYVYIYSCCTAKTLSYLHASCTKQTAINSSCFIAFTLELVTCNVNAIWG